MLRKIFMWPVVYIFKVILMFTEFIIWTPLELFGITNKREELTVKVRSIKPSQTKIKIYTPKGIFGIADRFFLNERTRLGEYIYYTRRSIINLFECNIKIGPEAKLFTVPKASLAGSKVKKDLTLKLAGDEHYEEEMHWIYVRDMNKVEEIVKTEVVTKNIVKEIIKELPPVIKPIKKRVVKPVIININQPVNKMNVASIDALLKEVGLTEYKHLTIGEKIELVRTTKLRTSRVIKKIQNKEYYNALTEVSTLVNIAKKLFIKIAPALTSIEIRHLIDNKAKLIKEIKFN